MAIDGARTPTRPHTRPSSAYPLPGARQEAVILPGLLVAAARAQRLPSSSGERCLGWTRLTESDPASGRILNQTLSSASRW